MSKPASTAQITYIRTLAEQAGYEGDRGYNAANDLLGDGSRWSKTSERASALIDALKTKLGISSDQGRPMQQSMGRCSDCGASRQVGYHGLGISCGCDAE